MSATATSRPSPTSPWSPGPNVSTTPTGWPARTPGVVGPLPSPFLLASTRSPRNVTTSPSYFGLVVENNSNPPEPSQGPYAKRNWDAANPPSAAPSPGLKHLPSTPRLDEFVFPRKNGVRTSDQGCRDAADLVKPSPALFEEPQQLESSHGAGSPVSTDSGRPLTDPVGGVDTNGRIDLTKSYIDTDNAERGDEKTLGSPFVGLSRPNVSRTFRSPSSSLVHTRLAELDGQDSRISFSPHLSRHSVSASGFRTPPRRAETSPASVDHGNVSLVSVERCAELLQSLPDKVLLLDVRPYPYYCQAHIQGSLNLCIPTTLLKRPSFNTQRLQDTFTGEAEKQKFGTWKQCAHIVVYDSGTSNIRDAGPLINVLKKFSADGWDGEALVLCGGFTSFSNRFPDLIKRHQQQQQGQASGGTSKQPLSMSLKLPTVVASVVGGCALPESSSAANPFFGNIRQNMDLVGGVGQMAVKLPEGLTESRKDMLPTWLRDASDSKDQGRMVSEKFLNIEKKELERMREALSGKVTYGPSPPDAPSEGFRVAGIEKGSKNRYNDIYPFDHSRVRLQDVPAGGCDYVNANYVKAEYTNKSYIATQAPVPDTFNDFWRVIWEQDVRVIVALTAEIERGQIKCHPYWNSGDYGPLKVKSLAERRIPIDTKSAHSSLRHPPSLGQRRSTNPLTAAEMNLALAPSEPSSNESPYIIVRHFSLSHSAFPFQPLREVTQLQYSYWPDFGTTSQPAHLLKLIEQCNKVTRSTSNANFGNHDVEPEGQRPVLVHCSAGCGRTGTFCTVDSVLDMLKRQRAMRSPEGSSHNNYNDSSAGAWVHCENVDLVAKTVDDFRTQRPSMVQNLSQFVLCYESVLEWVVSQMGEASGSSQGGNREEARWSYQG